MVTKSPFSKTTGLFKQPTDNKGTRRIEDDCQV